MIEPAATRDTFDGVSIVDGVFAPAFCGWLLGEARRLHADGTGFRSSSARWDRVVVQDSAPVLVHDLDGKAEAIVVDLLRQRGMLEPGNAHAMVYAWMEGSYIPWHNDGNHAGAVTVYLNDRWEPEWGGHFLYRAPDGAVAPPLVPRFNRGVRNGSAVPHCTTRVEPAAPEPRYTLQVFRKSELG